MDIGPKANRWLIFKTNAAILARLLARRRLERAG